jgi:hypothetical protein
VVVKTKTVTHNLESVTRFRKVVFLVSILATVFAHAQRRGGSRGGGSSGTQGKSSGSSSGAGTRGYLLEAQVFYGAGKAEADPPAVTGQPGLINQFETSTSFTSIKMSRIYDSGWNIAGVYSIRSDVRGSVTTSARSQGLGVGYLDSSGASIRLFYHLGETYGDFSDGKGASGELGYYLKLTPQVFLGFLLTHQQIQYLKNPLIPNFQNWTSRWSHPVITFAYSTR